MPAAPDPHLTTALDLLATTDTSAAAQDVATRTHLHLLASIAQSLARLTAHPDGHPAAETSDVAEILDAAWDKQEADTPPAAVMPAAVAALRDAVAEARAQIAALPDALTRYQAATQLAQLLRQLADDAAYLRARIAGDLQDTEHLSQGGLATRLGVSKARAGQLIATARRIAATTTTRGGPEER